MVWAVLLFLFYLRCLHFRDSIPRIFMNIIYINLANENWKFVNINLKTDHNISPGSFYFGFVVILGLKWKNIAPCAEVPEKKRAYKLCCNCKPRDGQIQLKATLTLNLDAFYMDGGAKMLYNFIAVYMSCRNFTTLIIQWKAQI